MKRLGLLCLVLLLALGGCGGESVSTLERQEVRSKLRDGHYLMAAQGSTLYCRPNLDPAALFALDGPAGKFRELDTGEPVSLLSAGDVLYYTTEDFRLCRLTGDQEEELGEMDPVSPVDPPELRTDGACGYGNDVLWDRNFYLAGELDGVIYGYQNTNRGQLDLYQYDPKEPAGGLRRFARVDDAQAAEGVVSGEFLYFLAKDGLHRVDLPGCAQAQLLYESESLTELVSLGEGKAGFLEHAAPSWWDGERVSAGDPGAVEPYLAAWDGTLYYPSMEGERWMVVSLDPETGAREEFPYTRNGHSWRSYDLTVSEAGIFVYCLEDDVDFYDFSTGRWLEE